MPVSADLVRVALVEEVNGAPPVSPVFVVARITGEGVAFAPTTTTSAELDPSGNIRDSILTGGESTGDISLEVSDHAAILEYLEGVLGAPFTGDVLIPGTALPLYTIEKTFPDVPIPGDNSYHRFAHSAFSAVTLTITPGSPITASASVSGGPMSLDTAILPGATYPDPGTAPVLVPSDAIVQTGDWSSTGCFGSVTLNFANGVRGVQCIGTLGTKEQIRGRTDCSITASLYYSNDEPLNALLDQTDFPVLVELLDAAGDPIFTFYYPRVRMTASPVVASGTGADVTAEMEMQALYDSAAGFAVAVYHKPASGPAVPVNLVLPAMSSPVTVGTAVNASTGIWAGPGPITYAYDWFIDGLSIGVATSSYTPLAGDAGKVLSVEVTATNADGNATAESVGALIV